MNDPRRQVPFFQPRVPMPFHQNMGWWRNRPPNFDQPFYANPYNHQAMQFYGGRTLQHNNIQVNNFRMHPPPWSPWHPPVMPFQNYYYNYNYQSFPNPGPFAQMVWPNLQQTNNFQRTSNIPINFAPYRRKILGSSDAEYKKVEKKFTSTNKKCFKVKIIEKIENPELLKKYEQRKELYKSMYGIVEEKELFHGTKKKNLNEICSKNFNWKLGGTSTGHLFGRGISFTPDSYYATHYGDHKEQERVMILAKVLISKQCIGDINTKIPPQGFDTTAKEDGKVIVKYEDNSYYPAYVIFYTRLDTQ